MGKELAPPSPAAALIDVNRFTRDTAGGAHIDVTHCQSG